MSHSKRPKPQPSLSFFSHTIPSPLGKLFILVTKTGELVRLELTATPNLPKEWQIEPNKYACGPVALQIDEFFAKKRKEFSLDFAIFGTPFQKEVWYRLQKIPYGETCSYSELARKVGRKDATRAVANAVAKNPIAIIIPCHRVIPKSGGIGNYCTQYLPIETGKALKQTLLDLEHSNLQ